MADLLAYIRRLRNLEPGADGGIADERLLERFVQEHDQAAFELLVWRHGPMVLGLYQRFLRHEQDIEDAFQAVFLILVDKASSIARRAALGGWLYRVAYRVALRARADAGKRRARERQRRSRHNARRQAGRGNPCALLQSENRLYLPPRPCGRRFRSLRHQELGARGET